jgi:hypothetical protein
MLDGRVCQRTHSKGRSGQELKLDHDEVKNERVKRMECSKKRQMNVWLGNALNWRKSYLYTYAP